MEKGIKFPKIYGLLQIIDDRVFVCDKDLNKYDDFDGEGDYRLITEEETIIIKHQLGDNIVTVECEDNCEPDKYNLFPLENIIEEWWESMGWNSEDEEPEPFCEEFIESRPKGYWDELKLRCLDEERQLRKYMELWISTYKKEEEAYMKAHNLSYYR